MGRRWPSKSLRPQWRWYRPFSSGLNRQAANSSLQIGEASTQNDHWWRRDREGAACTQSKWGMLYTFIVSWIDICNDQLYIYIIKINKMLYMPKASQETNGNYKWWTHHAGALCRLMTCSNQIRPSKPPHWMSTNSLQPFVSCHSTGVSSQMLSNFLKQLKQSDIGGESDSSLKSKSNSPVSSLAEAAWNTSVVSFFRMS